MSTPDPRHGQPLYVTLENAPKIKNWFETRGGLIRWWSQDLSNPETLARSWTGPAKGPDGERPSRPDWQCGNNEPELITDPKKVLVETAVEVIRQFKRGNAKLLSRAVAKAKQTGKYVTVGWRYDPQGYAVVEGVTKVVPIAKWTPKEALV